MTHPNSSEAYHGGAKQRAPGLRTQIIVHLFAKPDATTSMLAELIGKPRDTISPRMAELVHGDAVEESGTVVDPVTQARVATWRVTGRPFQPQRRAPSAKDKAAFMIDEKIRDHMAVGVTFFPGDMRREHELGVAAALKDVRKILRDLGVISEVQ